MSSKTSSFRSALTLLSIAGFMALGLAGCSPKTSDSSSETLPPEPTATPVKAATVVRTTLSREVEAPGHTRALVEQKVRAPFTGTLTALTVVEGDRVTKGETIGSIVARASEAALAGAREMLASAKTAEERADARRAVALAEQNRIQTPLTSEVSGIVVALSAAPGDRVAEDEELVSVADARSLIFAADVSQSDLAQIHPGEEATIELSGQEQPLAGKVHGLLTGSAADNLTAVVRVDFLHSPRGATVGLFGTVHIISSEHKAVTAVPAAALLRDDVSGITRVGIIEPSSKLHWVVVETGLAENGLVEIVKPALAVGTRVVTKGQVGLPEGTPLAVEQ